MGIRNLMILFFSVLAVSLVIFIVFFSLFFKNVSLSFDAKLPEAAPDVEKFYQDEEAGGSKTSRSAAVVRSTVNVPEESGAANPDAIQIPLSGAGIEPKPMGNEPEPEPPTPEPMHRSVKTKAVSETAAKNPDLLEPLDDEIQVTAEKKPEGVKKTEAVKKTETVKTEPEKKVEPAKKTEVVKKVEPAKKPEPEKKIEPVKKTEVVKKVEPVKKPEPEKKPEPPKPAEKVAYQVYFDGFSSEEAARKKIESLRAGGVDAFIGQSNGRYIVKVGTFGSQENASSLARQTGAKVKEVR